MAVNDVKKAWRLPMRNTGMRLNRVQPSLQHDLKNKKEAPQPLAYLKGFIQFDAITDHVTARRSQYQSLRSCRSGRGVGNRGAF
jgi:hypothetical protein